MEAPGQCEWASAEEFRGSDVISSKPTAFIQIQNI